MLTVTKTFRFEAAHHLPHYDGACQRLHGHSYKLQVTVTGKRITDENDPKCGMIIDFKDLKRIVNAKVVEAYDHSYLNGYFDNPTAENMVVKIAHDIVSGLPKDVLLVSCKLWETEDSYAEYKPEYQNAGDYLRSAT